MEGGGGVACGGSKNSGRGRSLPVALQGAIRNADGVAAVLFLFFYGCFLVIEARGGTWFRDRSLSRRTAMLYCTWIGGRSLACGQLLFLSTSWKPLYPL